MSRRWWVVAGVAAAVVAAVVAYRHLGWEAYKPGQTRLLVDLARPDALIRTASLARLPRDILRVPVAKDVLTEDFVYYYQSHEDRLGLDGAVRRIAYEHKLDWSDRLVAAVLDEPAEVALWRDGKGALRHYAIVIRRNALAAVLQEAATIALKDRQLTRAGELRAGGATVPVYALALNPRRTLLVAAKGGRLVVLSDPGLLLDKDGKIGAQPQAAVAAWLDDESALAQGFALDGPSSAKSTHTLAIGARAVSLGYAPFVPGFQGLRFDFGEDRWSTSVFLDPARLPKSGLADPDLWRAAPANPAACVQLPLDFQAAGKVVTEAPAKPVDAEALASLEGSALACWYRESSLYAPLFIARLSKQAGDRDAALKALAEWAIKPSKAAAVIDADLDDTPSFRLPETGRRPEHAPDGATIWRAPARSESDLPDRLAQAISTATLAAKDAYVFFSPDGNLVDLALDTLARAHPSAADQLPAGEPVLALLTPRSLAEMTDRETLGALSRPGDERLRQAAQTLLVPRTKALAQYPPYRLVLPASPRAGWQPVDWRAAQR